MFHIIKTAVFSLGNTLLVFSLSPPLPHSEVTPASAGLTSLTFPTGNARGSLALCSHSYLNRAVTPVPCRCFSPCPCCGTQRSLLSSCTHPWHPHRRLRTQEKSLVTSILPQMTRVFDILYITVFWSCCEVRASYFFFFLKTTPKQTKTQTPGFAGLRPVYALPLPRTGISACHDRPNQAQPCASAAPQPHIRLSKQQPGSLESKIPPKHSAGS